MREMKDKIMEKAERINEILQEQKTGLSVRYMERPTNNGEVQYGFAIQQGRNGGGPIFYYSQEYDSLTVQELAEVVLCFYKENEETLKGLERISFLSTEEISKRALPRIYHKRNYERFKEAGYLCGIVFDFVVLFYIPISDMHDSDCVGNLMLREEGICETVSFSDLFIRSLQNIRKQTVVQSLLQCLKEIMGELPFQDDSRMERELLIITTEERMYGAAAMLDLKVLGKIYQSYGDRPFYLLPSSVHEVLTVPADEFEIGELKKMVTEINNAVVEAEDILSNRVYYYNGSHLQIPGEERFYGTI